MEHIDAFPLFWPDGRPRAKYRQNSAFNMSLGRASNHLMKEIRLLGGKNAVLTSNLELRLDGLPYASQKAPDDPGIAVYFTYKDKQHCFASDDWFHVKDNVRAIGKTIEALRGISRWGTGDMMERAFQGFIALPAPDEKPWWRVLDFHSKAEAFFQGDFEIRSKKMLQEYHPDRPTGDEEKFKKINKAREDGREARANERA